MSKTFLQRCIIIPVIAAVVIGTVFFLFVNNARHLTPDGGIQMMCHDELNAPKTMIKNRNELAQNALVGVLYGGDKELPLRYNADYANLTDSASLLSNGCLVGETGTAYIKIGCHYADAFGEQFRYEGTFGELQYRRIDEQTVRNENAVFAVAARAHSSVAVYYPVGNNGLTYQYKVMMYEEG